jgi:hypothetical protein
VLPTEAILTGDAPAIDDAVERARHPDSGATLGPRDVDQYVEVPVPL